MTTAIPPGPPASPPGAAPAPRLALLLAALSALGPFSIDAYLPAMPAIARTLQTTDVMVQHTLGAFMIPFAVMTLWHGAISDAVGRRPVILWGIALFSLASIAAAFAPSITVLIVCRVLQGLVAGAGVVVGRAIVRDLFDGPAAQRMMSHVTLTFALAPAIAPIIGGGLDASFGWRAIFAFLVGYGVLLWLVARRLLPETLAPAARQQLRPGFLLRSYRQVFTSLPFVAIALATTLNFCGLFIYIAGAQKFMTHHLQVASTGFFWLFGPTTAGIALGSWLSGRFAGRVSARRTMAWGYGLMAVAAAGNLLLHLALPPALPGSVVPIFVYSLGMSIVAPSLTLLALDLFPQQRGLAASCQAFVQMGGAAILAEVVPLFWGSVVSLAVAQIVALVLGFTGLLVYRAQRLAPATGA